MNYSINDRSKNTFSFKAVYDSSLGNNNLLLTIIKSCLRR